jgi:hypothetical protein
MIGVPRARRRHETACSVRWSRTDSLRARSTVVLYGGGGHMHGRRAGYPTNTAASGLIGSGKDWQVACTAQRAPHCPRPPVVNGRRAHHLTARRRARDRKPTTVPG